jgi:WD40 repeat protein
VGLLDVGNLDAVALRPDGRRIVTVASAVSGGLVLVYDLTTPFAERLLGKLEPNHAVTGVTFSPDGSRIATSETDGTLSLWDASSFRRLLVLAGDADGKVVFSSDGKRLAYAARGGVVRVLTLRIDDLIQLAKARQARSTVKS